MGKGAGDSERAEIIANFLKKSRWEVLPNSYGDDRWVCILGGDGGYSCPKCFAMFPSKSGIVGIFEHFQHHPSHGRFVPVRYALTGRGNSPFAAMLGVS